MNRPIWWSVGIPILMLVLMKAWIFPTLMLMPTALVRPSQYALDEQVARSSPAITLNTTFCFLLPILILVAYRSWMIVPIALLSLFLAACISTEIGFRAARVRLRAIQSSHEPQP